MNRLAELLSGRVGVTLDARFSSRGRGIPSQVSIVRADGSFGDLIGRALSADPIPVAIVALDGRALVLTSGESGVIWTQDEGSPEQAAQVEVISSALALLGGLSLTGVVQAEPDLEAEPMSEDDGEVAVEPTMPKRKKKKKADDEVLVIGWIEEDDR